MYQICWTVDAGKLKSHERQAVSPPFELPFQGQTSFRLALHPGPTPFKGSASFKKAGGWGSVQLKCETSKCAVTLYMSISDGSPECPRQPRGPVRHDFACHSTCGLPRGQDQWDFTQVVDGGSQTFTVCLDIMSHTDS